MKPTRRTQPFKRSLSLQDPSGPLDFHGESLALTIWDDEVLECRMTVMTSIDTLERIESAELLHLTQESRMQPAQPPFNKNEPILIEMRLSADQTMILPADFEALQERLANSGSDEVLQAAQWKVLNVKQKSGPVMTGYQTTHFDEDLNPVTTEGMRYMEKVVAFFTEQNWYFRQSADYPEVLKLRFDQGCEPWVSWATTQEMQGFFAFYSEATWQVPEERRAAVAELASRYNYTLTIGNLEMDFEDGSVRMRTSVDASQIPLEETLYGLVMANINLFNSILPILYAVAFKGTDPASVLS